jgi:hypothetical protein
MAKNKKILILSLTLLLLAVFAVHPSNGSAQTIGQQPTPSSQNGGLVPCGGQNDPCTLCHFIIGFQNLINYGLWIVIAMAFVAIFFAGVTYIVSTGDESLMNKAKGFLKSSLIGFLLVAGAWMIVNTTLRVISQSDNYNILNIQGSSANWYTFTCSTASNALQGSPNEPAAAPTAAPAANTGGG